MQLEIQRKANETNQSYDVLNSQQLKDVARLVKHELKNLCFTLGTVIQYNFFNKHLTLKIINGTSVTRNDDECDLEKSFNKLNLDKTTVGNIFKITTSTHIQISCDNSENLENNAEPIPDYAITKEDIGGLSKQLDIIEEAMDFALGLRDVPKGKKP